MKLMINLLLLAITIPSIAQKKLVDDETPKNWEKLDTYRISDNGKFVWYKQRSQAQGIKIVLISSDGKFKRIFNDVNQAKFTDGGDYFICNYYQKDSIGVISLNNKRGFVLKGRIFTTSKSKSGELIAYQSGKDLTIMNLQSGDEQSYKDVNRFEFSPDGSVVMVAKQTGKLVSINTVTYKEDIINEANVENWCFDLASKTFTYLTKDSAGKRLWLHNLTNRTNKQIMLSGLDNGAKISDDILNLSPDGKVIYFKIEKPIKQPKSDSITDQLNVWSYNDEYSQWLKNPGPSADKQTIAYLISTSRMISLTDDTLKMVENGKYNNRYLLLVNKINEDEAFFMGKDRRIFLMDVESGEKTLVAINPSQSRPVEITGDEKYVIWYDQTTHKYMSHETKSGVQCDLSGNIIYALDTFKDPKRMRPFYSPYGYYLVQIGVEVERLIVADEFDLWELDPSGKKKPICLTEGKGRQKTIQYRLVIDRRNNGASSVFVETFNPINKDKGIYSLTLNSRSELKLKQIAPMQSSEFSGYFLPQKAANTAVYLIPQQKVNKSINLFVYSGTNNSKITNFHQEDDYNWFTSELHSYKLADGRNNDGILYKPENFDPSKKYPVIFYYYELSSHRLNNFLEPEHASNTLPIPWFVSNGYLVFVPDVTHQRPNPGERIYDCIISAAQHVAKLPYVDTKHMGLQGHSYGGYETNLMITKTNLFAAAQSSAGLSNLISEYGTSLGGAPGYYMAENRQLNMPGTPWQYRDLYINDSPIFNADKVTTPLLMMHGTQDGAVPFAQSLEMYFALRRLKKPVWMLEYEGEGHSLLEENNILDFTIRQQQFFDHYLKGKPIPVWMSRGIPSWEKGIKSGLELDTVLESK